MKIRLSWFIKAAAVMGLAIGAAGPAEAGINLVQNGNFGTGDFTNWTLSGDSDLAYVSGPPSTGPFAAALSTSSADGFLQQSIATLSGRQYIVSYQLAGDGATPNSLSVSLGGTTLGTQTNVPDTLPNYTTYTFIYTATAATSVISFDFRDDPGYLYLTNISVMDASAVPEPPTVVAAGLGVLMTLGYARRKHRRSKEIRFAQA